MQSVVQLVNRLQGAATLLGDNAGTADTSLPSLWSMLPSIVVIGGQVRDERRRGGEAEGRSAALAPPAVFFLFRPAHAPGRALLAQMHAPAPQPDGQRPGLEPAGCGRVSWGVWKCAGAARDASAGAPVPLGLACIGTARARALPGAALPALDARLVSWTAGPDLWRVPGQERRAAAPARRSARAPRAQREKRPASARFSLNLLPLLLPIRPPSLSVLRQVLRPGGRRRPRLPPPRHRHRHAAVSETEREEKREQQRTPSLVPSIRSQPHRLSSSFSAPSSSSSSTWTTRPPPSTASSCTTAKPR